MQTTTTCTVSTSLSSTSHGVVKFAMFGEGVRVHQLCGLMNTTVFLQTDGARERIPHFIQELHYAQLRLAEEDDSEGEDTHRPPEHQDDWMRLCQLNPRFTMRLEADSQVDWSAAARQLPNDVLRECPKWISSQRHLSEDSSNSPWYRQLPPVDVTTLNPKQQHAYDLIKSPLYTASTR